jgi:hypothetical protein
VPEVANSAALMALFVQKPMRQEYLRSAAGGRQLAAAEQH